MSLQLQDLVNLPDLPGAACSSDTRAERFFPAQGQGHLANPTVREAIAVCAGCPVQRACLQWALAHDEVGIWGGLTEAQRRRVKRRLRSRAA